MTKEEWQQVREQPQISRDVWFSFYKEKGGVLDNIDDFWRTFRTVVDNKMIFINDTGQRQVTLDSAMKNMFTYYDTKFGI